MSPNRFTDREMLEVLHLKATGITAASIGERMGRSKSSILGMIHRVNEAANKHPCRCKKPENKDGSMGPRWWAR